MEIPQESRFCLSCGRAVDSSFAPTIIRESSGAVSNLSTDSSRFSSEFPLQAKLVSGTLLGGRYRIVGLLGRGGMGEVYRADDLKLAQPVALKLLPERLCEDGAVLARFHREVSVARQVSHPNVCRVFDIGELDGLHFLSMEYIDGEDLGSLLRRIGRLPHDKAVEIARQLCAGLAAAHDSGVLHRDLKPANVMIDGRGRARITDFGLAGLMNQFLEEELIAGTPAYMAPEQLAGNQPAIQSDIYALGLVLYEIFTGKRAFDGGSFEELLRQHQHDTPQTPSSLIQETDPLVERIIMRCLDKDPSRRPSSALQVSASLPGGDPLLAALAAGETPSPEMVADAHASGALRPVVATACLFAFLILLTLAVVLAAKVELHSQVPLDKSSEVLADRAATMINRLGYPDAANDKVYGFGSNTGYLRYIAEHDGSPSRWNQLEAARPWGMTFWYRQSTHRLRPADYWNVSINDPALSESGMTTVLLDTQGRLIDLYCYPVSVDSAAPSQAFDWNVLFAAAELNIADFKSTAPEWVSPVAFDQQSAWSGFFPEQPQIPLHIEAAAFQGKPVYFEMFGPWTRPARLGPGDQSARDKALQVLILLIVVGCLIGGAVLTRRNLRLGRADRKGGFRLAAYVLGISVLSWTLRANHPPSSSPVNGVVPVAWITPVAWALYTVSFLWLFYIALEPEVRQRWPQRIVSWSRLLAGRWRDPLVGRDLLVGSLFGVSTVSINYVIALIPKWMGAAPAIPRSINFDTLIGGRHLFGWLFNLQVEILVSGFGTMILVLLFYLLVKREWLAVTGVWLLLTVMRMLGDSVTSITQSISIGVGMALFIFVLMRYGLFAGIASQFFIWLWNYPLTLDFSTWYASSGIFAMVIGVALASYGFYTSLALRRSEPRPAIA
jgi:serine/threonine-protein kinase